MELLPPGAAMDTHLLPQAPPSSSSILPTTAPSALPTPPPSTLPSTPPSTDPPTLLSLRHGTPLALRARLRWRREVAARGLGLLPGGDLAAVVESAVLRYSSTGDLLATLATDLDQPTELLVLSSGLLAVKVADGVVLLAEAGGQVELASLSGGCRGLAEDARGRLLAIDTPPTSPEDEGSAHPFVLYVDVAKDKVDAKLDLDIGNMYLKEEEEDEGLTQQELELIQEEQEQAELAHLAYSGGKLFLVDRGNSRLTVFYKNQEGEDTATLVGEEGEEVGVPSFRAPGGVAVDREGSCLVADTGNERLVVVHPMDQQEEYTVAEALQVSPHSLLLACLAI